MQQSLSEILNLLEIRGSNWSLQAVNCFNEAIYCAPDRVFAYFVLKGSIQFSVEVNDQQEKFLADPGDVFFIFFRPIHGRRAVAIVNAPQAGQAQPDADLMASAHEVPMSEVACCALSVRWPGGFDAWSMPSAMKVASRDNPLDMQRVAISSNKADWGSILTRAVSFMLVCAIKNHPHCEELVREANFRDPIGRSVQFMELHPFNPWTVDDLARKVGLGRSTFAARFHAQTGRSPMDLLAEMRMHLSVKLLQETDMNISEIAERSGYKSSSAFIRRFISQFDTTPGKIRSAAKGRSAGKIGLER